MKLVLFFLTIFFTLSSIDTFAAINTQGTNGDKLAETTMKDPAVPADAKSKVSASTLQSVAIFYEVSNACEGANLQLYAYGQGTYQWTGPNGFVSNELYPVIHNVTDAQSGIYKLKVIDRNGNENITSTRVKINKAPKVNSWASAYDLCEGDVLQLFSQSEKAGVWQGPNGFVSTEKSPVIGYATEAMSGVYTYTVVNDMGCTTTSHFDIKVRRGLQANANWLELKDDMGLSQVLLEANGGNTYEWSGPNNFTSKLQKPLLCQGTKCEGVYQVIITGKNGCQSALKLNIDLDDPTHKVRTIRPDFYLGRA